MIKINEKIHDLELAAFHQNEIKQIKLSDYKGKWLILFFYPADFTFVCPTELGDMADHYEQFVKEGAEVLSVSTDTAFVHFAWYNDSPTIGKIKFPMLADPAGKLARQFGVMIEEAGLALRGSFIIDPDGVLKIIELNDLGIGRSAAELLRKLQAAKFVREHGEVCPANWKPGAKTLKPGLDLVGKI
jgi:peroxiredoxin (alkyl hydroperoxide reductase subunit C)